MRYINKIGQDRHISSGKSRGAIIVEFALLLIPLLMIVAGIIEFGRVFWYDDALTKATRDGARFLSMSRASSTQALDNTLKNSAIDLVTGDAEAAHVPNPKKPDDSNLISVSIEQTCIPSNKPDCAANPDYVTVRILAYPVTIGGWIPFFVPTSSTTPTAATTTTSPEQLGFWDVALSPSTTMRYMH
jgi:hypothetical protein